MTIDEKFGFTIDTPHREKYGAVVNLLGKDSVRTLLPATIEELKTAYEADEHFNTISLNRWDAAAGYSSYVNKSGSLMYRQQANPYYLKGCPHTLRNILIEAGIDTFSVASCMCILKECAKQWVEEELEKENAQERA